MPSARLWVLATLALVVGCWSASDSGNSAAPENGKSMTGATGVIRFQNPTNPRNEIDSKNVPPKDRVLRMALLTNPPDLDPILISDTTSDGLASKIYNTLVTYDPALVLVPSLITAMPEVSEDRRTYTFELRPGVKFHNGRELTADDVKFSLTRLAGSRSKRANLIEPILGAKAAIAAGRKGEKQPIEGLRVKDATTIEIELEKPYFPFLYHLAMTNCAIVPREVVEAKGDSFSREPVGTGPFRLTEWEENNYVRLERFDDYFKGKPRLAGFLCRVIQEPLPRREEYKAGGLDIIDITQGMIRKWKDSNHAEDVVEWPTMTVEYYGFNLEKAGSPYAGYGDKARKLREAINWAVDRQHICDSLLEGRRFPSNGIIPKGMHGHDASRPAFGKDLDKAKALLAEAGYPDGAGLPELALWFNPQGDNAKIAQAVQFDLEKIGIKMVLKQLDWAAFINACDAGEPTFFRLGWVADYPDPENFLNFLFHSRNKGPQGNVTFFGNPEVDDLIDRSHGEADPAKRLEMLQRAERLVLEQFPWLFLTMQYEHVLLKPYVKNFNPTAMCDDINSSHQEWHLVDIEGIEP